MNNPFDAAGRRLIEFGRAEWLRFLGVAIEHPERLRVLDSKLSDISPEVDQAVLVGDDPPWIEHIELQAGWDANLPERLRLYSTLLFREHRIPVNSTVVLLRPEADLEFLTGIYESRNRRGDVYNTFRYNVERTGSGRWRRFWQVDCLCCRLLRWRRGVKDACLRY